ncbi:MAG: ABC transporter ATP-binding protein [bacterium]
MKKESEILLRLNDVKVHYGGVKALDGVDVILDEGEIVAIMGPNGAGKSTVIKAIFGIAPIVSGDVLWHERKVSPVSYEMVERGISYVPQGRRVFRDLTVRENLEIGGYTIRDKKIVKERMLEVLDTFPDLQKKLNDRSSTLSGGQQQMLAIARGLMTSPKVLLLDEPTLGLSPKIVKEVFAKIDEINKKHGTSIIVIEHNIKSLLEIATRAYLLDKGKVIFCGSTDTLENSGLLEKVFTGALHEDKTCQV